MGRKKRAVLIAAACVLALVVGLGTAALFGSTFFKKRTPEAYVVGAFAKTFGEIKTPSYTWPALLVELLNGIWQQDITLGVNRLSQDVLDIEPGYLSVAEVLTLKNTTYKDTPNRQMDSRFSLQMAVTTIAALSVYGEPEKLAVSMPQAFDYAVTLDPRQMADAWNASVLGVYLGALSPLIDNTLCYDYYTRILLEPVVKLPAFGDFAGNASLLLEGATLTYSGKVLAETPKGEQSCDVYSVSLTKDALNTYWRGIYPAEGGGGAWLFDRFAETVRGISFNGGLSMHMYVYDGKIAGLTLTFDPVWQGRVWSCTAGLTLSGELANLDLITLDCRLAGGDTVYTLSVVSESRLSNPELTYNKTTASFTGEEGVSAEAEWLLSWDRQAVTGENFNFTINGRSGVYAATAGAMGTVVADAGSRYIDGNLKQVYLTTDFPNANTDISLNVRYTLRGTDTFGGAGYTGAEMPLEAINEFDLLAMYARLIDDPQLGVVLGNLALF